MESLDLRPGTLALSSFSPLKNALEWNLYLPVYLAVMPESRKV
jgi:hypothetical protein